MSEAPDRRRHGLCAGLHKETATHRHRDHRRDVTKGEVRGPHRLLVLVEVHELRPEHDPKVCAMLDREVDVRARRQLDAIGRVGTGLACLRDLLAENRETLLADRRENGLAIGEVTIRRLMAHARAPGDLTQGQRFETIGLDHRDAGLEDALPQRMTSHRGAGTLERHETS